MALAVLCNVESRFFPEETQVQPGEVVDGRFLIERVLGQGGKARVFLVEDQLKGGMYALKVPRRRRGKPRPNLEREASFHAQVDCDEIVRLRGSGQLPDGARYLVLDWVDGPSVETLLTEGQRLELSAALSIAEVLTRALATMHDAGLLHRDVKPLNILVPRRYDVLIPGHAKLIDLGHVERLNVCNGSPSTRGGVFGGTIDYMSPEQVAGLPQGRESDLYALGATLVAMVYGRQLFTDGLEPKAFAQVEGIFANFFSPNVVHRRLTTDPEIPVDPSVPASVRSLIVGLLQRDPRARPRSAQDVLKALRMLRATSDVETVLHITQD